MKNHVSSLVLATSLAAAGLAGSSCSTDPYVQRGQIGGTVGGAVLGGILGNNINGLSTAGGAVAGALIGGVIGDTAGKANSTYYGSSPNPSYPMYSR